MGFPASIVHVNPDVLGGTPVFAGTRVPVAALYDYLEAGDGIGEFLIDFPHVTRQQVVDLLEFHKQSSVA